MDDGVGGAADGEKHAQGVFESVGGENAIGGEPRGAQPHRCFSRCFGRAQPIRVHGGNGGRPGQGHAERLREAGHGAGGAHHRAGSRGGGEPALDAVDLVLGYLSRPVAPPEAAAVRARAESLALPAPGHHGSGHELDGGHARGGCSHELGGHRLVAAAHEDHRVHGLGPHHLLDVHGHEIAIEHARRLEEDLAERDGGELDGQSARRRDAALDRLDQLGEMAVTVVEAATGIRDADHRLGEARRRVAHGPRKGASEIEGKIPVAVVGQSARQALVHADLRQMRPAAPSSAPRPKKKKRPAATRRTQPIGTKRCSLTAAKTASPSAASMPSVVPAVTSNVEA